MSKPLYRFKARVAESDPSGYLHTRWDRAQKASVLASTRDEAYKKIREMMGKPPIGSAWSVHIDSADEELNCTLQQPQGGEDE